jgi:Fe-S-cluster containining protein
MKCKRCGTCCRKGGPVLRREDLALIRLGHVKHDQLITIRKGEWGFNPASNRVEPVPVELLKIRGVGVNWSCLFLDEQNRGCTLYERRPTTCKILECWQPEPLLATIYENTLKRSDLINPDDPVLAFITRHERECSGSRFTELLGKDGGADVSDEDLDQLALLVRIDLAIRKEVAAKTGFSVNLELFLFGRPLFQQLAGTAIRYVEEAGEINLGRASCC